MAPSGWTLMPPFISIPLKFQKAFLLIKTCGSRIMSSRAATEASVFPRAFATVQTDVKVGFVTLRSSVPILAI